MFRDALIRTAAFVLFPAIAAAQVPQTPATPAPVAAPSTTPENAGNTGTTVAIPGGTTIKVAVVDKISSGSANVGDTFAVKVTDDVVVNGWVVIAKGAGGQGEVMSVDRAGSHGHAGTMGVQVDWVFAADGEKVRTTSERKTSEGENKVGAASTMTIVSWAFLGLPGLFMHNWIKGRDVELDSTHPLSAYTADTVHVVATTKSGAADGFAH